MGLRFTSLFSEMMFLKRLNKTEMRYTTQILIHEALRPLMIRSHVSVNTTTNLRLWHTSSTSHPMPSTITFYHFLYFHASLFPAIPPSLLGGRLRCASVFTVSDFDVSIKPSPPSDPPRVCIAPGAVLVSGRKGEISWRGGMKKNDINVDKIGVDAGSTIYRLSITYRNLTAALSPTPS